MKLPKKSKKNGSKKAKSKKSTPKTAPKAGTNSRLPYRPSLFPGKDISRHATAYLTPLGWDKLTEVQKLLTKRHQDKMKQVSVSDALEQGVHKLHFELTRPR